VSDSQIIAPKTKVAAAARADCGDILGTALQCAEETRNNFPQIRNNDNKKV
jgi:hypothetical protein